VNQMGEYPTPPVFCKSGPHAGRQIKDLRDTELGSGTENGDDRWVSY